jgi:hypothetical protein
MFVVAVFIGLYSYSIFFLGIFGLLTELNIQILTTIWLALILLIERIVLYKFIVKVKNFRFVLIKKYTVIYLLIFLITLLAIVNLIGALGPEIAFDALWYHLTLPKLYLQHGAIYHIPGGLLYYSDMPKLGEMFYVGALSFGNVIFAKLVHYIFGILISIILYKFSRKFFNQSIAFVIVVIFYSNLVVDWESITAYIDLIRTFFEFLSLWGLLNWYESQKSSWLVICAVMMGFAITTKLLAIGSFLILLALIIAISVLKRKSLKELLLESLVFAICTFIIPLPWFIFSYIHTGNPVYPFFTKTYEITASSPNPINLFIDLWDLFIHSADPISPVYLVFLPLLFVYYGKMRKEIKIIIWYCGLSLILWYFTPRTGGGRFIIPYLPAFSLISGAIYSEIRKRIDTESKYLANLLFIVIIFVAFISIGYRGVANKRYIPVILGKETKQEFLANNLNFHFGDFYDIDGYFAQHIKQNDMVLLFGFHNLYYIDFPFIDESWANKGDLFNYVAVQNTKLPSRFRDWHLVYSNDKTMVQLYRAPKGVCQKICRY